MFFFPIQLKLVCHPSVETDSPELIDCVMEEKKRHMPPPRSYGALKPEEALAIAAAEAKTNPENQEGSGAANAKSSAAGVSLDIALTKRVSFYSLIFECYGCLLRCIK